MQKYKKIFIYCGVEWCQGQHGRISTAASSGLNIKLILEPFSTNIIIKLYNFQTFSLDSMQTFSVLFTQSHIFCIGICSDKVIEVNFSSKSTFPNHNPIKHRLICLKSQHGVKCLSGLKITTGKDNFGTKLVFILQRPTKKVWHFLKTCFNRQALYQRHF